MSWGAKSVDKSILDSVLPEYQKISEVEKPVKGKFYKSIDGSGNIWLTTHPDTWNEWVTEKGQRWRARPKPKMIMKYADAKKDSGSTGYSENNFKY